MATSTSPTELVLKFSCPSCGHRLTIPVRKAGVQAPCPKCSQPVSAPPIDTSVSGYDAIAAAVKASMPLPPVVPPRASHTPPPQPAPPPPSVKAIDDELPAHSHTAPVADPVVGRTHRGGGFVFPWRARWTWRLLFWSVLVLFAYLFNVTQLGLFAFLGVFWFFPVGSYVTTWFLLPLCYPSFTCPGCHEVHDAVSYWSCSCGYVPHRPKHLFGKCPECGEGAGKTKCPRCGVSMLIW